MFGAKYQWILAGKYADDWWRGGQGAAAEADIEEESGDDEDERRCSDETLQAALNGYICADILILSLLQQQPTVADLVGYLLLSSRPPILTNAESSSSPSSVRNSHENSQKLNYHYRL